MKHLPLLLFAAIALSFVLAPNTKTTLSGFVRDAATKKPLAIASVHISQNGKRIADVVTDSAGRFSVKLEHATYTVECARAGYVTVRFPRIETLENQDRTLDIRLEPSIGGLEESVVKDYQVPYNNSSDDRGEVGSFAATAAPVVTGKAGSKEIKSLGAPATYGATVPREYKAERAMAKSKAAPKSAPVAPAKGGAEAPRPMAEVVVMRSADKTSKDPVEVEVEIPHTEPVGTHTAPSTEVLPDDIVMVDGVKKRMVIDFSPETYEEKVRLVDVDESAPAITDKADKTPATSGTIEPPAPRAGLLTAGEWSDLHNWNGHWLDLLTDGETDVHQKTYGFFPRQRYTILITNEQDVPLADVPVMLKSAGETIWEARTDNTGKAELWAGMFDEKIATDLHVFALVQGNLRNLGIPKVAKEGPNRHRIAAECAPPKNVDIVWAVDATGSMGDEIEYLKTELLDVIGRAKASNRDLSFRMGTTFYRDEGDEYIAKNSGLSADISKTVEFIRQQHAGGGGDMPEAVHSALEEAIFNQKWSENAIARICFLVLDASPHQSPEVNASLQRSIREAARRGIRLVPVTASGIQKDTEFLMKFFGLATNGTYVFLTDHSGIGGKHLEPTTDEYKVETLNDLLVRLITEYTSIETCEGKSSIRFEGDQQQAGEAWQALYYPNPASSQFTLELPFNVQSVTLYDAEGKAARKLESPQAGTNMVNVNDLADGFYTIRILKDGRMQSGKIMVLKGL